jgi:hypothetical protein
MIKLGFSRVLHKYHGAIMTHPAIKSQAKNLSKSKTDMCTGKPMIIMWDII